MTRHLLWMILGLCCALATGCPTTEDDDDTVGDDDTAEDCTVDPGPAPCAGGSWGHITDPEHSIHVRADGSDDGDGSGAAPLATLEEALERTRDRDTDCKRIAVGPGTFSTTLYVNQYPGEADTTDHGLVLEGCGPDETTLEAANSTEPIIKVSGADDVRIAGFRLDGGRRALWLWQGVNGAVIEALHVVNSSRLGIIFSGDDTLVDAADIEVHDVIADDGQEGSFGYGIAVQMAEVEIDGGVVDGAAMVGVLASHQALLTLSGMDISGVTADKNGYLGRGLQVQHASVANVSGCSFADNHDAGIFAHQSQVTLTDNTVDGTMAGTVPKSKESSGEGIVLSQGGANKAPEAFNSVLTDNQITNCARAGVLVEDVQATLDGNVAGADNGLVENGTSLLSQGNAVLLGSDTVEPLTTAVDLNWDPIATDDLTN